MNSNKVFNGDSVELLGNIARESVDLVIADPPYWKVVGEKWDYQWRTEQDYVTWCLVWLKQVTETMRLGGTLYLFGYFRTLALLVPHLDNLGLELRQQIIIDKGMQAVSGRATKGYKQFPNVTESALMIIKDSKPFIREFLKKQQERVGLKAKEINERLGMKSNGGGMWSIYTGDNICEQVPTRELWERMQLVLDFEFPYQKLSQTFNAQMGVTDVWTDINFYSEKRFHKTQKPQKLIQRLMRASSNSGDLVLDPFAGSGSVAVAAELLERNCISIEANQEYCTFIKERLSSIQEPLTLLKNESSYSLI
jgi:adenine-specific DNA-methyltransferase